MVFDCERFVRSWEKGGRNRARHHDMPVAEEVRGGV